MKTEAVAEWDRLIVPAELDSEWVSLLNLIPGYSSIQSAEKCRFDPLSAKRAIEFFPKFLKHVEGAKAGQAFILEPWQQAVMAALFGFKKLDESGRIVRRYRECLIYVPRKNGKTPWMAGLALFVLFCDRERGQQNYIAAESREQAGKLFRHAKGMVEANSKLQSRCRVYGGNAPAGQSKSIVKLPEETSFVQVISADANTQHGGNTHLAIIDELHAQPNRDLVTVLTTSTSSLNRKNPLVIYITTADYDRPSICNEKYEYASKVRDGVICDSAFLPVIYEASREDDWRDPKVWAKANPNLGISKSREYMERECKKAQENRACENDFRRLDLNQKTEQAQRVIVMEQWDKCKAIISREQLYGLPCYAGLDIGAMSDFTAFVLVFRSDSLIPNRQSFIVLPYFWLPEKPVRRDPRMQSVIDSWRKDGFIQTTPGNVVDYDIVFDSIVNISREHTINSIAFDRGFQGASIGNRLVNHFGEAMIFAFPQGIVSLNAPFRSLLELIANQQLIHDGNPVLRWMASNTAAEYKSGLMKPSKDKSAEKIDGITALTMALALALQDSGQANSPVLTEFWS